jgi:hypothetical protein
LQAALFIGSKLKKTLQEVADLPYWELIYWNEYYTMRAEAEEEAYKKAQKGSQSSSPASRPKPKRSFKKSKTGKPRGRRK